MHVGLSCFADRLCHGRFVFRPDGHSSGFDGEHFTAVENDCPGRTENFVSRFEYTVSLAAVDWTSSPPPPRGGISPCMQTAAMSEQPPASSTIPTVGSNVVNTPTVPPLPPAAATGGDGLSGLAPSLVKAADSTIFIENVPLMHGSNSLSLGDKITEGFHNSSRKTLSFVPLRYKTVRPYFHHLNAYVRSIWPAVREVTATVTGFYFFQFKTEAAMEEVIEGGPWLFQGQPIVLQKWEPGMALRKLKHTQVPVWIKLRHLPVEMWTNEGLSTVASGIGKPLYPDAITRACTRLDFARVCVMLDISSNYPNM
ncbi:hypothetical protein Sango_3017500 [Sesamum angolense]|uniref:DUF4283 domain-containing protein n=1 Tax=Sesamum angolense TaxID=2727404 RepID=A0AAE1T486_9LAMI|nr:hypothetical protein Sango_3017500 [Sesamum angolense]